MISESQLTSMQQCANAVLSDICTQWRSVTTDDGMGGGSSSLVQVGKFACYVGPHVMRPMQYDHAGILQTMLRIQVFVPAGTEVQPNDVLETASGVILKVVDMTIESNAVLTSVACERIR